MVQSDFDSDLEIKSKNKENKQSKRKVITNNTVNKGKKVKKVLQEQESEQESGSEEEVEVESEEEIKKNSVKKSSSGKKVEEVEQVEVKLSGNEKRLRAKLDAKTEALKVAHAAFTKLKELRTTAVEEQLKTLTELAAERQSVSYSMIQNYKSENDSLRTQLLALNVVPNPDTVASRNLSTLSSPPKAKSEDAKRVDQLLVANSALQAELTTLREKNERNERKKLEERDSKWEKQLEKAIRGSEEKLKTTENALSTIKVELEAEIQHSKSLQSKLKLTSTSSLPLARHGQGEEGAYKKLQEDHEELKSRLHLNEDCTGLMVNSFKRDPMGDVYSCVMSDLLQKTGSLAFNLTFNKDQSISYSPQLKEGRDDAIIAVIPDAFTKYMRFNSYQTGSWFRELFKSVNNIKLD